MPFVTERQFSSLADCIEHINGIYSGEITVAGKDRTSGDSVGILDIPAYLLRGESAEYQSTTATMQRVPIDLDLTDRAKQLIPQLSSFIEKELSEFLALSPMDSAGFAQHYGLPSELIDLTSSGCAGYFASGGKVGQKGYIAVFPTNELVRSSVLIDLRNHPKADRPRRQHAFGIFHNNYTDLKDERCIAELKSIWFGFTLTDSDKDIFQSKSWILEAHTDPVAGALQIVIDSMVEKHDKLPDEIAYWLSRRIAAAPFVAKVIKSTPEDKPIEVELVSTVSAEIPFDEEAEKERNYRYWSSKYLLHSRSEV